MDTKRGQALIELTIGLLALVLLVSALGVFAAYIVRSLELQNELRVGTPSRTDEVMIPSYAAEKIFGTDRLLIREKVEMPQTSILR